MKAAKKQPQPATDPSIKRLLTTLRKKLDELRQHSSELKQFEFQVMPAFSDWLENTYQETKQTIRCLDQEIEQLHIALETFTKDFRSGQLSEAKINAALKLIEEQRGQYTEIEIEIDIDPEEELFTEQKQQQSAGSKQGIDPTILEEYFVELLTEVRGIDIDTMDDDTYWQAFEDFKQSIDKLAPGDQTGLQEALAKVGSDSSFANISAVKKAYRKVARKIHPDRNLDYNEIAEELWIRLNIAKRTFDLDMVNRIELEWRVWQKDTFNKRETTQLKKLSKQITEELQWVKQQIKGHQSHPMWGKAPGAEPPKSFRQQIETNYQNQLEDLQEKQQSILNQIEEFRQQLP